MGPYFVPGTVQSTKEAAMKMWSQTPYPCEAYILVGVITIYNNSPYNLENSRREIQAVCLRDCAILCPRLASAR